MDIPGWAVATMKRRKVPCRAYIACDTSTREVFTSHGTIGADGKFIEPDRKPIAGRNETGHILPPGDG